MREKVQERKRDCGQHCLVPCPDRDKQLPYERFEISRSQRMCKGGDASENGGACWGDHLTLSTLPQPQAGPSSDLQSANPHTTRVSVSDPLVDGPVAGPVDEKRDRPRIVVEDDETLSSAWMPWCLWSPSAD
ncbi:hypothetical protein FALCPG4_002025 [Fusarium falciforme]